MDGADARENSNERSGRLTQRRHGYYAFALRGVAAALFLILSSFIRHSYITWQDDPTRAVTITVHGIRTPDELKLVCNGREYCAFGKELGLPDRRKIYHFQLKGLEPDCEYTFQVDDSYGQFRTLSLKPPYRFVEGGDWENTEAAERIAKVAASKRPDAVFLGGDYPSNVLSRKNYLLWDHWLDVYRKYFGLTPLVMAIGNHEVVGGYNQPVTQAPFFFDYFRTDDNPKSYYTIPIGDWIQLYILDSGHVVKHEEQRDWLEEQLDTKRYKIALYHVPLFPSVRFAEKRVSYRFVKKGMEMLHRTGRIYSAASNAGRAQWQPLFEKYDVKLAFEHHDQALKRTQEIGGTTYLGDGGWGSVKQYPPIQGYFHHYFAKLLGKEHFFWLIDVEEMIEIQAISAENKRLDRCLLKFNPL